MNNKDFITQLSVRLGKNTKDIQQMISLFVNEMAEEIDEDNSLNVQGVGSFEIKKKMERIVINPNTKQKMLIPPKLVLNFKPSSILKDKVKNITKHEFR